MFYLLAFRSVEKKFGGNSCVRDRSTWSLPHAIEQLHASGGHLSFLGLATSGGRGG